MLEDGNEVRVVARRFVVSSSVISRVWRHYQVTGQYSMRQGQSHLQMTPRQNCYLVTLSHQNRMTTARSLETDLTGVHLSNQTVRNQLDN